VIAGWLALACVSEPDAPQTHDEASAWVESAQVDAGAPVVLHAPVGIEVSPPEGMRATRRSEDRGRAVWELLAEPGSYVVEVPLPSGEKETLYVDIGVPGPDAQLEPLAAVGPAPAPMWPWLVAGTIAVMCAGWGGVVAWRRLRPAAPPPAPEPAEVRARRAWRALRAREDLDPEALAAALSDVYRDLLEATHPWPARSRTTREILDNLAGSLTFKQLESAQRLLGAMDLVKFSEHGARAAVFARLDADFDVLVPASTGGASTLADGRAHA
jgi:hypothetical protein